MSVFRGLFAVLAIVLGAVGVLAALTAIAAVWTYGRTASYRAEKIIAQVDGTVDHLDGMAEKSLGHVKTAEDATLALNGAVQLRALGDRPEVSPRSEEFDAIERRVISGVRQARDQLQLAADAARLVEQLLNVLENADDEGDAQRSSTVAQLVQKIESGRASVERASQSLDALQSSLAGIRENRNIAENAQRIDRASKVIGNQLAEVKSYLEWVKEELDKTKSWLDTLREKSTSWILVAQVTITLLAFWLAAAQLCLGIVGWRMWKTRPAAGGPHAGVAQSS